MSVTSKFIAKMGFKSNSSIKIKGRKACKCLKKCGNCSYAKLTKTYPNDGLFNEYYCSIHKSKVMNCETGCSQFNNRWKQQIKPK